MQLTIVGFHHRHECAASVGMACQRIFFTPLSFCLSLMPSFSPPSHLVFTWSGYGLLYCQTHSPHSVHEANVNTDRTFGIKITFKAYKLPKLGNIVLLALVLLNLFCLPAASPPYVTHLSPPVLPGIMVVLSGCEGCCILVLLD